MIRARFKIQITYGLIRQNCCLLPFRERDEYTSFEIQFWAQTLIEYFSHPKCNPWNFAVFNKDYVSERMFNACLDYQLVQIEYPRRCYILLYSCKWISSRANDTGPSKCQVNKTLSFIITVFTWKYLSLVCSTHWNKHEPHWCCIALQMPQFYLVQTFHEFYMLASNLKFK